MTWNPRNVFPNRPSDADSAGGSPSSSFDPSRTGDPVSPGHGGPAIGFGGTRLGGFSAEPRRRPIGFAPTEDEAAEQRYRTELSFKRHGNTPVASATPTGPAGDVPEKPTAWQSPSEPDSGHAASNVEGSEREISASSANPDSSAEPSLEATPVDTDVEPGTDIEKPEPEAEKQPFYKREITFRRKRAPGEETQGEETAPLDDTIELPDPERAELPELPLVETPVATTPVTEAPVTEAPVAEEPVVPTLHADGPVVGERVADEQLVDEPIGDSLIVAGAAAHELPAEASVPETLLPGPVAAGEPTIEEPVSEPPLSEPSTSDEPLAVDDPPSEHIPVEPAGAAKPGRSLGRRRAGGAPAQQKRTAGRGGKGRKLVGLKIGASQLAAAVVAETDAGHELVQVARRPLASGIVVDGEVRDVDALAHALKVFFDEEKLPKKDVRIGLASNRIGVRTLDIVGIEDQSQFDNAVRFKAHEVLPVAVHESLLDYRVLEERPSESGAPSRRVLLVVAPRDQVEPYQEVALRAGLRLAGIDLEALGLLRAFVDPKPFAVRTVDDTATVVVAMGHESSTLLVAGGGVCEFTRVFDWGGGALEDAIVQELDVHPAEAATILRHLSLSGPGRQFEGLDDVARTRVIDAMRLRLTPFARELVSSLQFYQTQPDSLGIGEIVITGGTSHLEGLADVLHQMIGVSVRVGDPLQRVVTRTEIDASIEGTIGSMAVSIGLGIDDGLVRGIDLLAGESKKPARRRPGLLTVAAPAAVVIPIAALALLFVQAHSAATTQQSQLDSMRSQIEALPVPTKPTIDASLASDQAARATAVANVLGSRFAWENVFRDLALALPKSVWLEHVVATVPAPTDPAAVAAAPPAAAGPQGVTIEGFTYTQPDVARLLARLATLPTLTNVSLQSSAAEKVGTRDVVHFTLLADLVNGGSR
jgi:type IV pilus assembly protein PilM